MERECATCGRKSDNKKDYFELAAKTGLRFICKECAAEIGIKNFMAAGFQSNTGVLKKYVKIHPEAQPRLDAQLEKLQDRKTEMKVELKEIGDKYKEQAAKDLERCPKCGNRAITKKEVFYWVDKSGNCVDVEE